MRAFGVEAERDAAYQPFSECRAPDATSAADFTVEGDWSGAAFLLVAGRPGRARRASRRSRASSSAPPSPTGPSWTPCARRRRGRGREPSGLSVRGAKARGASSSMRPIAPTSSRPSSPSPPPARARRRSGESAGFGERRATARPRCARNSALGRSARRRGRDPEGRGAAERPGARLKGGRVDARGDHRIAMAAAIASLYCEAPVEIESSECVAKSWPAFLRGYGRGGSSFRKCFLLRSP